MLIAVVQSAHLHGHSEFLLGGQMMIAQQKMGGTLCGLFRNKQKGTSFKY
jgi:hypothetical protein